MDYLESTKLDDMMAFINERIRYDYMNYPELRGADVRARQRFAISHAVKHIAKRLGVIAAESEADDHAGLRTADKEVLQVATTKLLIDTLQLASQLGMGASDLKRRIPEVMRSK